MASPLNAHESEQALGDSEREDGVLQSKGSQSDMT